jgi:hypothetical protein
MKNQQKLIGIALLALAIAVLYCCDSNSPTNTETPPTVKDDPSFSSDIQTIFNNNCTSSGCHGSGASAGLTLLQGQSYTNLVNAASTQEPGKTRVIPGDSVNSYIVIKLEGRQSNGSRMPSGGAALQANSIQNIKNWINKGAKNN